MKKLAIVFAAVLILAPAARSAETVYKYRQTVEIVETAGIQRYAYPVRLNLPGKDIAENLGDIRITDAQGNNLPFQVDGRVASYVKTMLPVDLAPNEKKTLYAFFGSSNTTPPVTSFGGVQQYIGVNFVTYAWGTVRISSYTKNNRIIITDNSNKTLIDVDGLNIAPETYQAGTQRTFTLKQPTMLKISCTGLASVAIGNFKAEETDSEAVIAGNILLYVPKFLAITSFHVGNKVQVYNGAELAQEKILGIGESLVFDGIPSGFRRIVADHECLIQYGTASAFSLFAVPGRSNTYRFLPIGPIAIGGVEGTRVDITYPDGRMPDNRTIGRDQTLIIPTESFLKNIGSDKTLKAIEIKSDRPITVLGTGGAGGHGSTYLPGNDGNLISRAWTTLTGNVDKENPSPRMVRLIAPYSNTSIKDGRSKDIFLNLDMGGLAVSMKEYSVEFSNIDLVTNENCLLLEGNPDDTASLFQVPALSDNTVKVSVPKTETKDGGWIPGKIETTKPPAEEAKPESGLMAFLNGIWARVNPKDNPLNFALTLIGLAVIFILIASIFVRKRSKLGEEEYAEEPSREREHVKPEPVEEYTPPEPETQTPQPERHSGGDWFEKILEDKPKSGQNLNFKAPRLRAPKISQFINTETNTIKEFEKTELEPDLFTPQPEPPKEKPEEKPVEKIPEPVVEENTPESKETVSEIDKIELSVSKITPAIRNLAHQLSGEGVVADPGSLVRLYKEGMVDLFSRIYIVSQSTGILPPHISNMGILEKTVLTPKDLERVAKLARDIGVFEEVARALVLAEKNNLPNYITSAKLPERLGKVKITSVNSFC